MPETPTLNFDATGEDAVRKFMRDFFVAAADAQRHKHQEYRRIYRMYKLQMDMSKRDPNRSNIFVPKLFSSIETLVPNIVDALTGLRPYIPIELDGEEYGDIGDAQTDLVDRYLEDADFDWHAIRLVKFASLYGLGFIEALPDYERRIVTEVIPRYSEDYRGNKVLIGYEQQKTEKYYFKLLLRTFAPWDIYKDPAAKSLNRGECRGIIKFRGLVSKRQLQGMADRGAFPNFDPEKLQADMTALSEDNWGRQLAESIGVPTPKHDDDLGVWLSFECTGRQIDFWNFNSVLRDQDNQFEHGDINLTRVVSTDDPNPESEWYGVGDGRPIEQLCYALNDNWNQTFDNHHMQNQAVIFYDDEALNVDQLVMVAGNRIPVTRSNPNERIEDCFSERKTPPLNRDHYAIPQTLERMIDLTLGQFNMQRGETAPRSQTAREAIMLKGSGDARTKLKVKLIEKMGLKNFGGKVVSIIDQFAMPDDIVAKLGPDRATLLPTVDPANLSTGARFSFKGSDRIAQQMIHRQDQKDVFQLLRDYMNVDQQWLVNWLLQGFDVSREERRKAVRTDEKAMELQAIMAQLTGASGGAESTRAISSGQTMGGRIGYSPSGRDRSEKLGARI